MQFLESMDVYAKPVGNFLTINKQKRVSTAWGLCCSSIMVVFTLLAAGFLIADMVGTTNFFSQSVSMTVADVGTDPVTVGKDEIIITYTNSMDNTYMVGYFFQ